MPRLLRDHHRFLARPNSRHLRWLLNGAMSTYRRQSKTHRGMLIPEKVELDPVGMFLAR